jgi:N-acetylglucosaminyldiphosphoundecaprenol N-acetyl-beta-D-mannosaminyltransferase
MIATAPSFANARPSFGGIPLDTLGVKACLARLETFLEGSVSHQVATVNLDFIARAQRDRWLRAILNRTALNLVDGAPLVWALRALGHAVPERVAGADLVPLLLDRLAQTRHSVYLLGGTPEVAGEAARRMVARYEGLRLCGVDSPPTGPVETIDREVVSRVRRAAPALLLVALGNPKQEYWLDLHLPELGVPVAIGIGGTVDFLAARRRRAPRWMRRCGLEWLARLAHEPTRLGPRYANDLLAFIDVFTREQWARRVAHG